MPIAESSAAREAIDVIWNGIRSRPITATAMVGVGMYCLWMGFIIHYYTVHLPAVRLIGYAGPVSIMPLDAWAWTYLTVGIVCLLRLTLLSFRHWTWDYLLHVVTIAPLIGWSVGFDVGAATTGMPSYTVVAVVATAIPFVTPVIEVQNQRLWQERAEKLAVTRTGSPAGSASAATRPSVSA